MPKLFLFLLLIPTLAFAALQVPMTTQLPSQTYGNGSLETNYDDGNIDYAKDIEFLKNMQNTMNDQEFKEISNTTIQKLKDQGVIDKNADANNKDFPLTNVLFSLIALGGPLAYKISKTFKKSYDDKINLQLVPINKELQNLQRITIPLSNKLIQMDRTIKEQERRQNEILKNPKLWNNRKYQKEYQNIGRLIDSLQRDKISSSQELKELQQKENYFKIIIDHAKSGNLSDLHNYQQSKNRRSTPISNAIISKSKEVFTGVLTLKKYLSSVKNNTTVANASRFNNVVASTSISSVSKSTININPGIFGSIPYPVDDVKIFAMFGIDETFYRSLGYDGGHRGVDFNVPIGTAVKSVADGVVSEVGYQEKGYGYYIKIKHKIGDRYFETIYAHGKEKSNLKVGDTVKQGNLIMLSGDTGIGGAHLHFGLRLLNKNGNVINESDIHKGYIDPISWFKSYSGQATEVNGLWPDWVNKELTWALDRNIISPDSIMQIIASTAVKYTMLEILFNFQKIIKDSKTITNRKILGEWPIWAADAVNWGINKGIVNEKSVMSAVDNESFKYTFITMLYKYYLNVLNGSAFAGKIIDGSWPDWADTAVSWAINNGLIDSKESVMQAVSSDAMKYTAIKMLYRFSNI